MLIFFSDRRVPHEVLPAHTARYAATIWYFNDEERLQALKDAETAAEGEKEAEQERIRKEIAKFEGKYGASAVAFEGAEKATEVVDAAPPPDPLLDGALQDFNRRKGTLQLTDEPAGGAAASGALAGSGTAGVTAGASRR